MTTLALALLASSQPILLTQDFGVMSVPALLKEVNAKSGWRLKESPTVAEELIYCNVKGMGEEEFMDSLQKALGAKWVKSGESFLLRRDPQFARRGGAAQELLDFVFAKPYRYVELTEKDALNYVRAANGFSSRVNSGMSADEAREILEEQSWGKRGLQAFAHLLGRSFFESLQDGDRVVFSTKPTPSQRSIPPQVLALISGLKKDDDLLFRVFAEQYQGGKPALNQYNVDYIKAAMGHGRGEWTDLDFTVTMRGGDPVLSLRANLEEYSLSQIFLQSRFGFREYQYRRTWKQETEVDLKKLPWSDATQKIVLSPKVESAWKAYKGASQVNRPGTPAPELIESVLHPEKGDPLHVLFDEPLDQVVRQMNRGLIAVLPDDLLGLVYRPEALTGAEIGLMLHSIYGSPPKHETLPSGLNDCVVMPDRPSSRSLARAPRRASAALAAAALKGSNTLDALAAFSLTRPTPDEVVRTQNLFGGIGLGHLLVPLHQDQAPLRIYGQLGDRERKLARSGGLNLLVGGASPAVRSEAQRMIFGHGLCFNEGAGPSPAPLNDREAPVYVDPYQLNRGIAVSQSWEREPTRFFPNGLPSETRIKIEVASQEAWFGGKSGYPAQSGGVSPLNLDALAYGLFEVDRNPSNGAYRSDPDVFQKGKSTVVLISFFIPGPYWASGGFVMDDYSRAGGWVPFDRLPQAFKQAVNGTLDRLRESSRARTNHIKPPQ